MKKGVYEYGLEHGFKEGENQTVVKMFWLCLNSE